MGKELPQLALEFLVVELVDMVKIRLAASFGVVEPVGRGDDELAVRRQDSLHLGQETLPVFQVFDNLERDDNVKRSREGTGAR